MKKLQLNEWRKSSFGTSRASTLVNADNEEGDRSKVWAQLTSSHWTTIALQIAVTECYHYASISLQG